MSTPLVSVIIPVYNGEKTIKRCIKSILKQTYQNIEIVCVNDGSKDASLDILEALGKKYSRIHVVNQVNQGAFQARRNGILSSTGEYILFADIDDTLPDKESIGKLVNYINNDKSIHLIQFTSKKTYKNGLSYRSHNTNLGKLSIKEFYEKYAFEMMGSLPKNAITAVLWDKMYNAGILRDVIADIEKLSIPVGEDLYLNLMYLDNPEVKNIYITDDAFYNYYKGIGVMSKGDPWKAIEGYSELKKLQFALCDKWKLNEEAKYNCHMETIYYRFVTIVDELYNKNKSEEVIVDKWRSTNSLYHYIAAKEYFEINNDKVFPELEVLLNATPEEYLDYVKNNRKKPDGLIKRKLKAILNR